MTFLLSLSESTQNSRSAVVFATRLPSLGEEGRGDDLACGLFALTFGSGRGSSPLWEMYLGVVEFCRTVAEIANPAKIRGDF